MKLDLVFEGGGAKGIAYVGALQALEDHGVTPRRIIGTSAGAITAALMAAGYSAGELRKASSERLEDGRPVFAGFMDRPWYGRLPLAKWAMDALRLEAKGGVFLGEAFERWLEEKIRAVSDAVWLEDLPDLTLVASHREGRRALYLNARTAPRMPVVKAVRASMSIPAVFVPVSWEAGWGRYLGEHLAGDELWDGGLVSNLALELLIRRDQWSASIMGDEPPDSDGPLALVLDESKPAPGLQMRGGRKPWFRTTARLKDLAATAMGAHDAATVEAYRHLVVMIPAGGVGTIEFGMSEASRLALIRSGKYAAHQHLRNLKKPGEMDGAP